MWPVRPNVEFSQGNCFHCCSLKGTENPNKWTLKCSYDFLNSHNLKTHLTLFLLFVSHFLSPLPIFSPSAIHTQSVCLTLSLFHSPCAISFSPLYHLSLFLSCALILPQIEGGRGTSHSTFSPKNLFLSVLSYSTRTETFYLKKKKGEKKEKKKRSKGAMSSSLLELKHTRKGTDTHTHKEQPGRKATNKRIIYYMQKRGACGCDHVGPAQRWPLLNIHSQHAAFPPAPMPCCPLTAKHSLTHSLLQKRASIILSSFSSFESNSTLRGNLIIWFNIRLQTGAINNLAKKTTKAKLRSEISIKKKTLQAFYYSTRVTVFLHNINWTGDSDICGFLALSIFVQKDNLCKHPITEWQPESSHKPIRAFKNMQRELKETVTQTEWKDCF